MHKTLKQILLLSLLGTGSLQAQTLFTAEAPFKTIFGSRQTVNPYYTGSNPAFLNCEISDQLLSVQSAYKTESGDFRRFIDPEQTALFQMSASGKKSIDSLQLFKGSFGFQRIERNGWHWIQTRDYNTLNPFLLGDSTTGKTHYNGIVMKAEYGTMLFSKLLAGFSINYNVDESLKEVFPRPTGDYRDIDLRAGFGYLLNENYSAGISARIYDNLEKIKYLEDEGGISQEVFLLKFRGYDYPFVNKKKTENRSGFQNGIFTYGDFAYSGSMMKLSAYFGGGIEQLSIKDDASRPANQGYWQNSPYEGALRAAITAANNISLGVAYRLRFDDMWAKHALGSVLLMENKMKHHEVKTGIEYSVTDKVTLGAEGGFISDEIKYTDYYSPLSWKMKGTAFTASLGAEIKWNEMLNTFISYGINSFSVSERSLQTGNEGPFFGQSRAADILFMLAEYIRHSVNSVISIKPAEWGIININLAYSTADPASDSGFRGVKRDNFYSTVEFRIKA
ncbi:MAG: DUF6850 family outer membrane beta-barrel protein, partial [Syntrophothermus sp.]